jgi:hypothetical protein
MLAYKNEKRPHIAGVGLHCFRPVPALSAKPGAEFNT